MNEWHRKETGLFVFHLSSFILPCVIVIVASYELREAKRTAGQTETVARRYVECEVRHASVVAHSEM
jgi:hypothetical protein